MSNKVVIIGGVAGGASCAARLRRLDEKAEIILLDRGGHVSFANCGLPYHLGGAIDKIGKLLVETPESIKKKYAIDVRVFNEALAIDRSEKKVRIKDHAQNREYEESYDYLVLSPGADPVVPPVPGIENADNVFTVSTIPDLEKLINKVAESKPQTAVVVGGGYIGMEMAENLKEAGLDVCLVELLNQVLPALDIEMAGLVEEHLVNRGVKVFLGEKVAGIIDSGQEVLLAGGKKLKSDILVFAAGVSPVSKLARDAGLSTGIKNTIKTDPYLRTSDPHIYALGDAIEVKDFVSELPAFIPLAGPANRQGRIVANNICGRMEKYAGTLGTSVVKVFELTIAATGNNEKMLGRLGFPYKAIHIHPQSHAMYYPGSKTLALKMLFNPVNGKIYGAQAVGEKGAEKRIDVIAAAIKAGMTVFDLKDLELSYAPPYSSAKDPVNMLGFVASNIVEGVVKAVQWHEIDEIVAAGGYLVDVREENEYNEGCIKGAVNIPLSRIRERLKEIPGEREIYVYCRAGLRSYIAYRNLVQNGFNVTNLDGGYLTYVYGNGKGKIGSGLEI